MADIERKEQEKNKKLISETESRNNLTMLEKIILNCIEEEINVKCVEIQVHKIINING